MTRGFTRTTSRKSTTETRVTSGARARSEPVVAEGHESEFVDDDVLGVLDPEARSVVLDYVHDLARGEEHRAWEDIVRFTRRRDRTIAREERLSPDLDFAATHVYSETANRIMGILARDFEQRAEAR